MKVIFLKPGAKFKLSYFVGDVATIEDKQAGELIEAGICEQYAKEETTKETETKAPAKAKTAKK